MKAPSFFSRLAGNNSDYDDEYFGEPIPGESEGRQSASRNLSGSHSSLNSHIPNNDEAELAVDVYQASDALIVRAFIAGVPPNTIDISLTREMLTISGSRSDDSGSTDDAYYIRELYWGGFSRTILLPEEIDVDTAEASEKYGVLTIRLPKVDKARQAKLKIRAR